MNSKAHARAAAVCAALLLASAPAAGRCADAGVEDPLVHTSTGAESAGFGGAYAAASSRGEVVFYNPSGLDRLTAGELLLFRAVLPAGATLDSLLFAWPFAGPGSSALAVRRISAGEVVGRDDLGVQTGLFGYERWELLAGYGRAVSGGLYAGGSLRLDSERLGANRTAGASLDVGLSYPVGSFTLGVAGQNLTALPRKLGTESESVSGEVRAGIAGRHGLAAALGVPLAFEWETDLEWIPRRAPVPRLGAAVSHDRFAVRGGWRGGAPALGASVDFGYVRADYAMSLLATARVHRVAVALRLGGERAARIARRRAEDDRRLAERAKTDAPKLFAAAFAVERLREGRAAAEAGLLGTALRELSRAKVLAPDDPDVRTAFAAVAAQAATEADFAAEGARASAAEGKWEEADALWSIVLDIRPDEPEAKAAREKARVEVRAAVAKYVEQQKELVLTKERAAQAGRELARTGAELSDARRRLLAAQRYSAGVNAYYEGRHREAEVEFEATAALYPKFERVDEFLRRTRLSKQAPTKDMPAELLALYREGLSHYLAGRYEQAIASWQKILARDPTNPLARRNIEDAKKRLTSQPGS